MQMLPRRVKVVTETVPQLAVGTKQTKINFNAEVNFFKKNDKVPPKIKQTQRPKT